MKKEIDVLENAAVILKAVNKGVLLSTNADGRQNAMTISWGTLGINWHKMIFTTFVRESRFTKEQLDKTTEFTVSMAVDDSAKKILAVCGSKSGRDMDKIAECGLTMVEPSVIKVGGYKELPLTLECRILYKQELDRNAIGEEEKKRWYPVTDNSDGDYHTAYVGEIVAAYVIE